MANDTKTIPMFYCLEMGLQPGLHSPAGRAGRAWLCSGQGGPGHRAVEEDGEKRKSEDLNRFQHQLHHSTTDTWSPGTMLTRGWGQELLSIMLCTLMFTTESSSEK